MRLAGATWKGSTLMKPTSNAYRLVLAPKAGQADRRWAAIGLVLLILVAGEVAGLTGFLVHIHR